LSTEAKLISSSLLIKSTSTYVNFIACTYTLVVHHQHIDKHWSSHVIFGAAKQIQEQFTSVQLYLKIKQAHWEWGIGTGGKAAGAWNWPLISNQCQVKKMWIYISSPPYAFMAHCLNSLSTWTNLPCPRHARYSRICDFGFSTCGLKRLLSSGM
jgi:hypothetical protein